MDKYEYNIKLEQIKKLIRQKDYATAARIADTIEWYRVKNNQTIVLIADVYEASGRYEQARENLKIAYDRSGLGRQIAFKLVKICIKCGNIEEAEVFYEDFISAAPKDNSRYLLEYELAKAKGMPLSHQIAILENYLEEDMDDRWGFELARLYHKSGQRDKCIEQCDTLMLWFSDGRYVEKAMELKMMYTPLTPNQQQRYEEAWRKKSSDNQIKVEEIKVKEVDVQNKYNTQNIQAVLKESMDEIYAKEEAKQKRQLADEDSIFRPSIKNGEDERKVREEIEPVPEETDQRTEKAEPEETDQRTEEAEPEETYQRTEEAEPEETYQRVEEAEPEETYQKQEMPQAELYDESEMAVDTEDYLFRMAETAKDHDLADTKIFHTKKSIKELGDTKVFELPVKQESEEAYILEEKTIFKKPKEQTKNIEAVVETVEMMPQNEETVETMEVAKELYAVDAADPQPEVPPVPEVPQVPEVAAAEEKPVIQVINWYYYDKEDEAEGTIEGQMSLEDFAGEDGIYRISKEQETIQVEDIATGAAQNAEKTETETIQEVGKTETIREDGEPAEEEIQTENIQEPEEITEEVQEIHLTFSDTDEFETGEILEDLKNYEMSERENLEEFDESAEMPEQAEAQAQIAKEELEILTEEVKQEIDPFETVTNLQIDKKAIKRDREEKIPKRLLTNAQIKEIIKEFIGKYSGVQGLDKQMLKTLQNVIVDDNCNIFIMGDAKSGKTTLGIDIIKVVNKIKSNNNRRIAKISAEKLNGKDISMYFEKLEGSDLFIENISAIDDETLQALFSAIDDDFDNRIVVIEDEKLNAERFLNRSKRIKHYFANTIVVKQNKIKDWAAVAEEYANERGYRIDEMGMLALHAKIDQLYAVTLVIRKNHVEMIIDNAIKRAQKVSVFKKIFGGRKQKVLSEEHFNLYE